MDDASRLVSELHNKLAELDLRVWNYRRDIAAEFTQYAEDLLRTVPPEISETVSKIIAKDLKDYKSLNHDTTLPATSGATGSNGRESSAQPYLIQSNTPYAHSTAHDYEQDSSRDLHDREHEHDLQGLFTPSYLPLLDHSSRERPPSATRPPTSSDIGKRKEMEEEQGKDTHVRVLGDAPDLRSPSLPVRRSTDEISINSTSDRSDGPVRRSALRRSIDNSRLQSPRRVRFDVMGEEVLPTSSPQQIDSPIEHAASYVDEDDEDEDDDMDSQHIEDLEDSPPRKRKVSTTKVLQALTRQPLEEDGAQWTTVSSGSDGEPVALNPGDPSESDTKEDTASNAVNNKALGAAYDDNNDDADTVSDDGMADMPPLSPMPGKRATPVNIPARPTVPVGEDKPTKSPTPPGKSYFNLDTPEKTQGNEAEEEEDLTFLEEDEDNLFHFDESGPTRRSRSRESQEESDSESDSGLEMGSQRPSPVDPGYSRSPALNIPSRMTPPQSSSIPKPSVGSYKGHPFSLPIVSDELHAQAASLGTINTFVGSVTGRSGLDPSDVQSFRESLKVGSFTGEPKSMMERMMMEDFMEAEKEKAAKEKKRG